MKVVTHVLITWKKKWGSQTSIVVPHFARIKRDGSSFGHLDNMLRIKLDCISSHGLTNRNLQYLNLNIVYRDVSDLSGRLQLVICIDNMESCNIILTEIYNKNIWYLSILYMHINMLNIKLAETRINLYFFYAYSSCYITNNAIIKTLA